MDKPTLEAAFAGLKDALKPIEHLMADPMVQEIEINGPDDVWVERSGEGQVRTAIQLGDIQIRNAISVLARMTRKSPKGGTPSGIIDAFIEGFRVAAVLPPTAVKGPYMCIRKHNPVDMSLQDYVNAGSVPKEVAGAIECMVSDRKNLLVAGGTSSGKTTFVNAILALIPESERIYTVEDALELKVKSPNWIPLVSNKDEGVTTRMLIKLALRFRPDRIIVGEVRDDEAYDLLQAANTGHDGCVATLHANSAFDALSRFETMILQANVGWPHAAICRQIARTFDYVLFMHRLRGRRYLAEIIRLTDYDTKDQCYVFEPVFTSEGWMQ